MKLRGKKLISIVMALALLITAVCTAGSASAAAGDTVIYKYLINCNDDINAFEGEVTYPETLSPSTISFIGDGGDYEAVYAEKDGKIVFNATFADESAESPYNFKNGAALVTVEFTASGDYDEKDIVTKLSEFYNTDIVNDGNISYKYTNTVNDEVVSSGYADIDNPDDSYINPVVTFNNDGETTTQIVEYNTAAVEPTAPTKDGYVFKGWYNGDTEFDFTTPITSDLTLTSKWKVENRIISGNTVSFKDNLTLNFLALIDDEDVDGAYVNLTYNHYGEEKVVKADANTNDKLGSYYRFRCELTASEMTIPVKAELYINGSAEPVSAHTRSIRDVCVSGLNDSNTAEAEKTLLRAALNYGGYTQERFRYNGEPYAYEDYKDSVTGVNVVSEITESRPTGVSEGIEYIGSSVFFRNAPYARYYFKLAEGSNIEDYTFTLDGNEVTPVEKSGRYYFDAPAALAYKLDDAQNIVVKKGSAVAFDFNYSVIKWAEIAANDTDNSADADMAKAIFKYYEAAKAYVYNTNG